ncbi:MAG: ubiquinone biosynthesis monooxygenase Coq7 [Candidatus Azotimanducaceae bacterium]
MPSTNTDTELEIALEYNDLRWLVAELRSDHAGEMGAVAIYQGILKVTHDDALQQFAQRHLQTEKHHLAKISALLPAADQSRLLPVWRVAGFLTGAIPACFGPAAVFITIDAVETFVESHYLSQIKRLADHGECEVRELLSSCLRDEVEHRDEARHLSPHEIGLIGRSWQRLVGTGSNFAVSLARRF